MRKYEIKESCFQFGEHRQLVGILTEPIGVRARRAFVLIPAGLMIKFGHFRHYAQVARRLSSEGILVVRFDLGGIGDSGQGYADHPRKKRSEFEIRAALDHLSERYDLEGIVLGGLCSGAEDSFRYAERDPRVTGVVLMDPFGYETFGSRWRTRLRRTAGRLLRRLRLYSPYVADNSKALIDYRQMEFGEASRILKALIRRKTRMHFVYSGGMRQFYNHRSQFKKMFGKIDFQGLVTLDYFPQMQHTHVLEEDRRKVTDAIARALAARP